MRSVPIASVGTLWSLRCERYLGSQPSWPPWKRVREEPDMAVITESMTVKNMAMVTTLAKVAP